MAYVLVTLMSAVFQRPPHISPRHWRCGRQHKHDPYVPARRIHDLAFRKIAFIDDPHTGEFTVNVTGTFTVPTARKSGAALAPSDIDHFSLHRNGVEIDTLAVPAGPTVSFSDATPLTGSDTYEVFTITKDGFISDPSNDAVVSVAAADPAAAVSDLQATLNP
jgi:hypothetical protein